MYLFNVIIIFLLFFISRIMSSICFESSVSFNFTLAPYVGGWLAICYVYALRVRSMLYKKIDFLKIIEPAGWTDCLLLESG